MKIKTTIQKQLPFKMDNHTTRSLSRIGRTEDIHISPDGQYLAVAAILLIKLKYLDENIEEKKCLNLQ